MFKSQYDSTPKKSRRKRDSNPGSSALESDALTTRPTRQWGEEEEMPASQQLEARDTEAELKQQGTNWSGMTKAAQNRVR